MTEFFEFSSITEMRWIRFREYLDKVIQMEEGSFIDSPRSQVLLAESKRQASGGGMGLNLEPREGFLFLLWKGSEFVQKIEMYEEEMGDALPKSHIDFSIEVCDIKDEDYLAALITLERMARSRAGFTYVLKDAKIILQFRISFDIKDEFETYSMIMCLFYRQHAYATQIANTFRKASIIVSTEDEYSNDQFVGIILSQEYRDSLNLTGFSDDTSPEGVPEAYFFKDARPEVGICKLALEFNGENIKYKYENDIHSATFTLGLTVDDTKMDFIGIIEYSNLMNPIFLTGDNEFKKDFTKDQTVSVSLMRGEKTSIISKTNIETYWSNGFKEGKVLIDNKLNQAFSTVPYFGGIGTIRSAKYNDGINEYERFIYELPISLGQILFLNTSSNDQVDYFSKFSNYVNKFIWEVAFKSALIDHAIKNNAIEV